MKKARTIIKNMFDPTSLRVLAIVVLTSMLFPIVGTNLQFRHTLAGVIYATSFIYMIPCVAAFLITRLFCALNGYTIRAHTLFLSICVVSIFLICNSFVSPFFIDIVFFAIYNPQCLHEILSPASLGKFVTSYTILYKAIAGYAVWALGFAYGLFAISCALWPLHRSAVTSLNLHKKVAKLIRHGIAAGKKMLSSEHIRHARPYILAMSGMLAFAIFWSVRNPAIMVTISSAQFRQIDSNGDGVIDQAEFKAWLEQGHDLGLDATSFDRIDTDHNSRIDAQEWQHYIAILANTEGT